MSAPENKRTLVDVNLSTSVTLPLGANTASSDPIDLGTNLYPATKNVVFALVNPAIPTLAANTSQTLVLQHSSEANANYAAIPTLGSTVLSGSANGVAAGQIETVFPPGTKRYVRLTATGVANANANGLAVTLQARF